MSKWCPVCVGIIQIGAKAINSKWLLLQAVTVRLFVFAYIYRYTCTYVKSMVNKTVPDSNMPLFKSNNLFIHDYVWLLLNFLFFLNTIRTKVYIINHMMFIVLFNSWNHFLQRMGVFLSRVDIDKNTMKTNRVYKHWPNHLSRDWPRPSAAGRM